MTITALIFDFDGLLVDTETPSFQSWSELYTEHGQELSFELWKESLGTSHGFDPLAHLLTLLPESTDAVALSEWRLARKSVLSEGQPLLPGVRAILGQARALGLPCAVASSSGRAWVEGWLLRHEIYAAFRCIRTAEDVTITKPAPDLFLSAAACLGAPPASCLVFEDSPNGIRAAHAAGMRCVAVRGPLTRQLALPPADLVLDSLATHTLREILAHFT